MTNNDRYKGPKTLADWEEWHYRNQPIQPSSVPEHHRDPVSCTECAKRIHTTYRSKSGKTVCHNCRSTPKAIASRFWQLVDRSAGPNECWVWTGRRKHLPRNGSTYGVFFFKGKTVNAHGFAYELFTGKKLKAGHCLDHLCYNGLCVNPSHWRESTDQQNAANKSPWSSFGIFRNGYDWTVQIRYGSIHYGPLNFPALEEALATALAQWSKILGTNHSNAVQYLTEALLIATNSSGTRPQHAPNCWCNKCTRWRDRIQQTSADDASA